MSVVVRRVTTIAVAVAAVAAAALLAGLGLLGAASARADFTPAQEAQMREAVEQYAPQVGYPGIVAGVWQEGVGEFVATTGVANLRTGAAMGTGGHVRIGSVTKTMTATLVLQLVQRGRLHLQDSVSEYVDGVPKGRRITIRMLLNHTSGIHNFTQWLLDRVMRQPHRNWPIQQIVRRALERPRYCKPGACWVYSNTNYFLLGEIVREVTGKRLRDLYERRIWDRLGMGETSFHPRRPTPEPAVHGYVGGKRGPKDVTDWNFSWAWTAGGASSTLADLRRWARALATGEGILNERMQRKRLRSVPTTTGDFYGLGILETPPGALGSFYGHDGQTPGYDSLVLYSPSAKVTFVALGNASTQDDPVTRTPFNPNELDDLAAELLKILAEG